MICFRIGHEEDIMKLPAISCFVSLVIVPAVVLAAAAPATGPGQMWTRHQLYAANELNHYRLFEQTTHMTLLNQGNFIISSGQKGEKRSHTMELKAAIDHLVMVTCDEDCFDVNLRVYDASGKMVGEDMKPPPVDTRMLVARVQFVPAATQMYRFEVETYCREGSIGACSYAVGVNTK
jgi:hypothetical protein